VADTDAGSDTADSEAAGGEAGDPVEAGDEPEHESPSAPAGGIVIPVEPTPTLRATIAHAVEAAIDEGFSTIHLVEIASWRNGDPGARTIERRPRSASSNAPRRGLPPTSTMSTGNDP